MTDAKKQRRGRRRSRYDGPLHRFGIAPTPSAGSEGPFDAAAIIRGVRSTEKGRPTPTVVTRPGPDRFVRDLHWDGAPFVKLAIKKGGKVPHRMERNPRRANPVARAEIVADGTARARLDALQRGRRAVDLIDSGATPEQIATALGIATTAAQRLMRRRASLSGAVSPEEVILERAVGAVSTAEMIKVLQGMRYTAAPPPEAAWFDPATGSSGTIKQLVRAFQDGLLTEQEYERLSGSVRVVGAGA